MKVKVGKLTNKGRNVYEDTYGKLIIAEPKNRRGYIVDKDKLNEFSLYQNRIIIPLLIFVFVGFYFNWILSIALTIASYVILEILYKKLFLTKLQIIDNIDFPSNKLSKQERMKNDSNPLNISKLIACIALPVLMVVNLILSIKDWSNLDYNNIILIVVTIACTGYAINTGVSILNVLTHQK